MNASPCGPRGSAQGSATVTARRGRRRCVGSRRRRGRARRVAARRRSSRSSGLRLERLGRLVDRARPRCRLDRRVAPAAAGERQGGDGRASAAARRVARWRVQAIGSLRFDRRASVAQRRRTGSAGAAPRLAASVPLRPVPRRPHASGALRGRRSHAAEPATVAAGAGRQPGRDRAAGHPHLPCARHRHRGGVQRRRRATRPTSARPTPRCAIGPAPAAESYLDIDRVVRRRGRQRCRRGPPGLRLPVRARRVRPGGP